MCLESVMKKVSVLIFTVMMISPLWAKIKTPEAQYVKYTLFRNGDEGQVGSYSLKKEVDTVKETIKVSEIFVIEMRPGKKMQIKSSVIYSTKKSYVPTTSTTETKYNGKLCMTGTLTFKDGKHSYKCSEHLKKRTGVVVDPAVEYVKKDQNNPAGDGILLYRSAIPVLAPLLLKKEGELENIIMVEFPKDIDAPTILKFRENGKLTREAPEADGSFKMSFTDGKRGRKYMSMHFDKSNELISLPEFGGMRAVIVEGDSKKKKSKAKREGSSGSDKAVDKKPVRAPSGN
jgi:hypothetical protein